MDEFARKSGNWPKRVLEFIFDNLHFRTRVNARLVCRHWYNVQLAEKYVDQDKIVCRGLWEIDRMVELLYACKGGGRLKNVEFQSVHFAFKNYNTVFWTARGWQIRELRFLDCIVDRETFELVVKCCANLRTLYWDDRGRGVPVCSYETLKSLISENVSRGNLQAFETTGTVSVDWLLKFRRIFPNASRLSYVLELSDDAQESGIKLPKISDEKLLFKFRNCNLSTDFQFSTLMTRRNMTMLQEIEINIGADSTRLEESTEKSLRRLICRQSNLQKLTWVGVQVVVGHDFLQTLFERCPELDWLFLQFEGSEELRIKSVLVEKIKFSQLRYLRLSCRKIVFENAMSSRENRYLRFLAIKAEMDFFSYHVLVKYFACLDHLDLEGFVSVYDLITPIATYASQISGLRVVSGKPSEKKPQKNKISVKTKKTKSDLFFSYLDKLTSLKYLSIHFVENLHKDGLEDKFRLPKLEYLYARVDGDSSAFFKNLMKAVGRSKRLRAACFVFSKMSCIPFKSWIKFCSAFDCLEYLALLGSTRPHKQLTTIEIDLLFHRSRSLRVFVRSPVDCHNPVDESHVYDRKDGKIFTYTREPDYFLYTINSTNLESHVIDWLRF